MAKDLLLEIGAEEIPASFIVPALADLEKTIREGLASKRLAHGELKTYGTPRRLAVYVKGVAEKTEDVQKEVLGPPVRAAFDKDGKPTKAGEKFAEGLGLKIEQLLRVNTPKGEYLAAKVEEKGQKASALLAEVFHQAVHGINFKKSMRWGDVDLSFARPLHWIVALHGEEVIPVVFADVKSGRTTRGHRFLSPDPIELKSPETWLPAMSKVNVIPDIAERRKLVHERIKAAAEKAGGKLMEDDSLLDQVTNLVELPNPVVGTFDARHLDLPPEVLVQEMKSHQRYFSILDANGKLMPKFVAVSNTPVKDEKLSLRGYERVLRARLTDGRFFFDQDRKQKLEAYTPKLERVVFQQKLGSYAEKTHRVKHLALDLASETGLQQHAATIERAAPLIKADLVTGMVGEFPELQGVMGREYALHGGEKPEVAQAIFEHYLPRSATDALPTQNPGALIGLADRFDTLCGIFAIGKGPTAAADPFGLRRACLAIINITQGRGYRYSLSRMVDRALELLEPKLADVKRKAGEPPVREQILEFFRGRLKALWGDAHRADVVEAVLSVGFDDLVAAKKRLDALSQLVGRADFAPLAVAFKRVVNIVEKQGKDVASGNANPAKFTDEAERSLHGAFTSAGGRVADLVKRDDYAAALKEITSLKPAVDQFFDKVMVMAEDRDLRENRIRFLTQIGALFNQVADFSKIQADLAA